MNMVVIVRFRVTTGNEGHREKAARNQTLSNVLWYEDRGNAKHNPGGLYGNQLGGEKRTFQMENWMNKARKMPRSLGLRKLI